MNQTSTFSLQYGLAAGFLLWAAQEFFLIVAQPVLEHAGLIQALSGLILGAIFGAIFLMQKGVASNNKGIILRGLKYGALSGAFGGLIGFAMIHQIMVQGTTFGLDESAKAILDAQRWLFVSLFVAIGIAARDMSSLNVVRALLSAAVASALIALLFVALTFVEVPSLWARGLVLVGVALFYSFASQQFYNFRRAHWLKSLNGALEGQEFELSQAMLYLGTQNNDQINLGSYPEVNTSHAKLIRYYTGYSLVDNDPFFRTYVNFRNITEQPLKNGDIIKIGTALFQYCKI